MGPAMRLAIVLSSLNVAISPNLYSFITGYSNADRQTVDGPPSQAGCAPRTPSGHGDLDGALTECREAARLAPDDRDARVNLAHVLFLGG